MAQAAWSHGEAEANGIRVHYVSQGQGPLVLLLHGFPELWYSWRHQLPALAAAGFRAVAPDLRGYGGTDAPRRGYDVRTLAADVRDLVRALGYRRAAAVVGHDWGGGVAWALAAFHPEALERLVILNAPHPGAFARGLWRPDQLRRSWYMFFFQIPVLPERLLARRDYRLLERAFRGARGPVLGPEDLEVYKTAFRRRGLTGPLNYYRALFRPGALAVRRRLERRLEVPTLVIWGEQDFALGKRLTEGLDRWVADVRVRYVPTAGHWVQQEEPEVVTRAILEFLDGGPAGRA
ncbi:MAG TPA: alpha/beta hydrolase [Dehalococcoidia bacterium]